VVIESLAVGVPVIAYARGGPAELVTSGQTGFVVKADCVPALAEAVGRVRTLDRADCRRAAELRFSLDGMAARTEEWLARCRSAHRRTRPRELMRRAA